MRKTVVGGELASRFVNLDSEQRAEDFLRDYKQRLRPGVTRSNLYLLAWSLRDMWDEKAWSGIPGLAIGPGITLEQIFAGRPEKIHDWINNLPTETVSITERSPRESDEEYSSRLTFLESTGVSRRTYERGEVSVPENLKSMEHPAFRIRLGNSQPVFEPRDILDEISYSILKASQHGLLKICLGHRREFGCPMPYLVADEHRRIYCYKRCGDEAKSRATKKWKKKQKQERELGKH